MYKGYAKGYVFKLGQEGVGYYLDVPVGLALDTLIPQDEFDLYRFNAAQWRDVAEIAEAQVAKRARRQRTEDGKRKKKKHPTRRKLAIDNLPDDTRDDDTDFVPPPLRFKIDGGTNSAFGPWRRPTLTHGPLLPPTSLTPHKMIFFCFRK